MASKSIRDRRLTGARIPESKKTAAILFFVDGLPATEVCKIVEISLDSARAIRDREHDRIMKLRETISRECDRWWLQKIEAEYKREEEKSKEWSLREILSHYRTPHYRTRKTARAA